MSSASPSPTPTPSATPLPPAAPLSSQSLLSLLFPTGAAVDCAAFRGDSASARTTYACTTANVPVRLPLTVLHLLTVFAVLFCAAVVYVIAVRVGKARADRGLRLPPAARPLPVGRDALSRRGQLHVFEAFAAAAHDFSPAAFLRARKALRREERKAGAAAAAAPAARGASPAASAATTAAAAATSTTAGGAGAAGLRGGSSVAVLAPAR